MVDLTKPVNLVKRVRPNDPVSRFHAGNGFFDNDLEDLHTFFGWSRSADWLR